MDAMSIETDDPYAELIRRFDLRNLFDEHRRWDSHAAQKAWLDFLSERGVDNEKFIVVCLGRNVASAVGIGTRLFFDWFEMGPFQVVSVPHPSGLNRLLNDKACVEKIGQTLHEALRRAS